MSTTIADLARELAAQHGDDYDEALRVVTTYAIQLGVETGVQAGGQAPAVELDAEQADHIYRAYEAGKSLLEES